MLAAFFAAARRALEALELAAEFGDIEASRRCARRMLQLSAYADLLMRRAIPAQLRPEPLDDVLRARGWLGQGLDLVMAVTQADDGPALLPASEHHRTALLAAWLETAWLRGMCRPIAIRIAPSPGATIFHAFAPGASAPRQVVESIACRAAAHAAKLLGGRLILSPSGSVALSLPSFAAASEP